MKIGALFLCLIFAFSAQAQNAQGTFSALRITMASTHFLSDLGGKNAEGSNDFTDLDFVETRFAIGTGYQVYFGQLCLGATGFYARLAADDRHTVSKRSSRQLHVVTDVIEASVSLEYEIPPHIPLLHNFYFNIGAGIMYFEPHARYEGKLHKLRPLGTEGQNYDRNNPTYSYFAPVIPFGLGYRFQLPNRLSLALDMSLRKSFTDYLDDTSTYYGDRDKIRQKGGEIAAHLSDPTGEKREGQIRGNPQNNDQYVLFGFRLEIPLRYRHTSIKYCPYSNKGLNYPIKPRYRSRYK